MRIIQPAVRKLARVSTISLVKLFRNSPPKIPHIVCVMSVARRIVVCNARSVVSARGVNDFNARTQLLLRCAVTPPTGWMRSAYMS